MECNDDTKNMNAKVLKNERMFVAFSRENDFIDFYKTCNKRAHTPEYHISYNL